MVSKNKKSRDNSNFIFTVVMIVLVSVFAFGNYLYKKTINESQEEVTGQSISSDISNLNLDEYGAANKYVPASYEEIIPLNQEDLYFLVYNSRSGAIHLMTQKKEKYDDSNDLVGLTNIVNKLFSLTEPLELENGYTFYYKGGYPIWGPFSGGGPKYQIECLLFTNTVKLENKNIYVWGAESMTSYHRYDSNIGRPLN